MLSVFDNSFETEDKIVRWLKAGTQSVWLVDCRARTIEVRGLGVEPKLFEEGEVLSDDEVVVGFRIPVAKIFADLVIPESL